MVGKYSFDFVILRQLHENGFRESIAYIKTAVHAQQFQLQFLDPVMDKAYAAVIRIFQRIQNMTVENKDRNNGQSGTQGMVEACIVLQPQVAAKPENDDTLLQSFLTIRFINGCQETVIKLSGKYFRIVAILKSSYGADPLYGVGEKDLLC